MQNALDNYKRRKKMSKTLIPIYITFKLKKGKYVLYYKGKRYKEKKRGKK